MGIVSNSLPTWHLCAYGIVRPYRRSFFMRWVNTNGGTYNWSKNKGQVSVEDSATNEISVSSFLKAQGQLWVRVEEKYKN